MKAAALHERIRADLERRILDGDWPPGARIPFEHELTHRYRCSRMTVSKAVSALARQGLIVRRKRAGSFVALPREQSATLAIPDLRLEVQRRGDAYRYELLERRAVRVGAHDPLRAQIIGARRALLLRCRHFADDAVFALEERAISLTAVPSAADVDFSGIAPGAWLLEHVPWSQAEHRISAAAACANRAIELGVAQGQPCLVIERRTWRGNAGITHVRLTYPADQYEVVAQFAGR